jgi:hypothetical protein
MSCKHLWAILISYKVDFNPKLFRRHKGHFTLIKGKKSVKKK